MAKRRKITLENKKYELEFIGQGGFAIVYKATPIDELGDPGESVAIKEISKTDHKWRRHEGYVRTEIEIHRKLNHPNIVKLINVVEKKDAIYLILELCSMTLHDYVKEPKPDFDEYMVYKIFKQIVAGVQDLHKKLIIHRDLKLKNILLTKDMKVKIADFGLSTRLEEDDEPKYTVCGTIPYMAPEICGKKSHSHKADIWNLGCILNELLLKVPPDRGKEPKFSDEAMELLKDLLEEIPAKRICIEKVPESRFFKKNEGISRLKNRSDDSGNGSRNHLSSPIEKKSHFRSLDSGFNSKNSSSKNSKSSRKKDYSEKKVAERGNYELRKDKLLSTQKHYLSNVHTHDRKRSASEDRKPFKPLNNPQQVYNSRERSASAERKQIMDSKSPCCRDYANDPCRSSDCYKSQDRYKNNDSGINSAWKIHRSCIPEPTEHCNDPSCRFSNSLLEGQHKVSPSTCSHIGCCYTKCSHVATCCCHSHSYHKHHLKNINNPEKLNEHSLEQLTSPLNAVRLKPKRHMPKNLKYVLHISTDGQVIVEVLKTKKGEVYVSEVFIISTDGMEIKIYKPPRNTLLDDNRPPPFPNDSNEIKPYDYQKLPKKYHEKYLVAKRFVDILRVQTPKLIIYGQNANFYMMENSPDPDMKMEFYDGGRVIKKDKIISITDMHGRKCDVYDGTRHLDQNFKSMLAEFQSEKDTCERMPWEYLESLGPQYFPIRMGTPKDGLNCSGPKTGKENFASTSSKTNRGQRR